MAEQTIKEGESKMTLLEELKLLLEKDERLVSEGKLLKNRIVELALKLDKDLIKLLLSNGRIKEHFFKDVDGILVFDKEKFMKFVDNKEFLPDSYTAFKNKIGLTADKNYIAKSKEVVLSWPYKDCILEGGQEESEEKRKEIFHNEILAPDEIDRLLDPKVFTNFKRIDAKGEHEVKEIKPTDNLIIKGNNLLALHSLKKEFAGKVKLIYIDPPYNTGNDSFGYNDRFNHSTWLTFMKNRLEVAKILLKEDGIIFIHCDDREHSYLKVLLDEIFLRDNFVSSIAVRVKAPSGVATGGLIFDVKENILVYKKKKEVKPYNNLIEKEVVDSKSKTIESYNLLLISEGQVSDTVATLPTNSGIIKIKRMDGYDIKRINTSGVDDVASYYADNFNKIFRTATLSGGIEKKIKRLIPDNGLFSYYHTPSKGKWKGQKKKYYVFRKEGVLFLSENAIIKNNGNKKVVAKLEQITNIIARDLWQGIAKEGGVELKYGKKPEELLRMIIDLTTKPRDIVLDFFAGTGTTCAVAHKMDRQYVGVEQLDYGKNSAVVRLKNVINGDQSGISKAVNWKGGGDFVYCELMELNEKFIQRIQDAKDTKELLKIWEEMKQHAFLSYKIEPKDIDENIDEFKDLSFENQKRFLIEILDKNDLYVNYSEMEDKQYGISREDIELNKKFYRGR